MKHAFDNEEILNWQYNKETDQHNDPVNYLYACNLIRGPVSAFRALGKTNMVELYLPKQTTGKSKAKPSGWRSNRTSQWSQSYIIAK